MAWFLFYLALSAAALGFAALSRSRDRRDAIQIAALLLFGCCAYEATRAVSAFWLWPVMDAATAWFVAVRDRRRPANWKLFIVLTLFAQEIAHARWQLGDKFGGPFYGYGFTLNALYVAQLFAVASSGSSSIAQLRDYVAGRVRGRRRWRGAVLHRRAFRSRQSGGGSRR